MIMLNVVFEAFVCIINKQKKERTRRRKERNRRHLYKCMQRSRETMYFD